MRLIHRRTKVRGGYVEPQESDQTDPEQKQIFLHIQTLTPSGNRTRDVHLGAYRHY